MSASTLDTCKTSNYKKDKPEKWQDKANSREAVASDRCNYWGRAQHPFDQCLAGGKKCSKCSKTGHFKAFCWGGRGCSKSRGRGGGTLGGEERQVPTSSGGGQTQAPVKSDPIICGQIAAHRFLDDAEAEEDV